MEELVAKLGTYDWHEESPGAWRNRKTGERRTMTGAILEVIHTLEDRCRRSPETTVSAVNADGVATQADHPLISKDALATSVGEASHT